LRVLWVAVIPNDNDRRTAVILARGYVNSGLFSSTLHARSFGKHGKLGYLCLAEGAVRRIEEAMGKKIAPKDAYRDTGDYLLDEYLTPREIEHLTGTSHQTVTKMAVDGRWGDGSKVLTWQTCPNRVRRILHVGPPQGREERLVQKVAALRKRGP
jgi:hypothetical protein